MSLERIDAINIDNNHERVFCYLNVIDVCENCHTALRPDILSCYFTEYEDNFTAFLVCFCPRCKNVLLCKYEHGYMKLEGSSNPHKAPLYILDFPLLPIVLPCKNKETEFSQEISRISPCFVKIYNQSLEAETIGLNEIAGIGYRKSLEFLVKDFAINEYPEKMTEIINMPLAQCIKNYIDNPQINILLTKSAWIGNDETHYQRKFQDRNIDDLKKFIQAAINFIDILSIVKDAESIQSANQKSN